MRVYKITTPGNTREFITNEVQHLDNFPAGSVITVAEMTPEEYHRVPATTESAAAFKR